MFSQRNNPYCELHKISDAKIGIFIYICKYLRKNRVLYTYQHKKTNFILFFSIICCNLANEKQHK